MPFSILFPVFALRFFVQFCKGGIKVESTRPSASGTPRRFTNFAIPNSIFQFANFYFCRNLQFSKFAIFASGQQGRVDKTVRRDLQSVESQRQEGQRQEGHRQEGQRQEGQRQEGHRHVSQRQEGQRHDGQRHEGRSHEIQIHVSQIHVGQRQEGHRHVSQRHVSQRQEGQRHVSQRRRQCSCPRNNLQCSFPFEQQKTMARTVAGFPPPPVIR